MKQCICDQLADIVEGESIKNFQDKIAYKEIAFILHNGLPFIDVNVAIHFGKKPIKQQDTVKYHF